MCGRKKEYIWMRECEERREVSWGGGGAYLCYILFVVIQTLH